MGAWVLINGGWYKWCRDMFFEDNYIIFLSGFAFGFSFLCLINILGTSIDRGTVWGVLRRFWPTRKSVRQSAHPAEAARKDGERGFTLIEMAIVMVIAGLIMAGIMEALAFRLQQQHAAETKDRIERIQTALLEYASQNGRLPCPASRTAAIGTPEFGMQTDCTTAPAAGTVEEDSLAPPDPITGSTPKVRIGAVPVKDLRLSKGHMADGWGRRITYAVATDLASTASSYASHDGVISVTDQDGNSQIIPADTAAFVVLSHGPDGRGGYDYLNGSLSPDVCGNPATDGIDAENCNDDSLFLDEIYSTAGGAGYYDDYIAWAPKGGAVDDSDIVAPKFYAALYVMNGSWGSTEVFDTGYPTADSNGLLHNGDMIIPVGVTAVRITASVTEREKSGMYGDSIYDDPPPIIRVNGTYAYGGTDIPLAADAYYIEPDLSDTTKTETGRNSRITTDLSVKAGDQISIDNSCPISTSECFMHMQVLACDDGCPYSNP